MRKLLCAFLGLSLLLIAASARAMNSANYSIDWDSVNSGGDDVGSSTNYGLQDTLGEQAAGFGTSASYTLWSGYRFGDTSSTAATSSGGGGNGGGGGGGGQIPDTTAPIISNVQVINITTSTATIIWQTNEVATSQVEFGLTTAYGVMVSDGMYTISHSLDLTQLTPGTLYHFRVSGIDTSNNQAVSQDFIFTTASLPLVISNIQVTTVSDSGATIIWQTDPAADSQVNYGTTATYGLVSFDPLLTNAHSATLNGLLPNTLYHFFITATAGSTVATSTDFTFTTGPDTTPPANALDFTATPGDAVVFLNWILPPDPDVVGIRIVRDVGTFPIGPFNGTLVYQGNAITTIDAPLTNGITYFYKAFTFDAQGNVPSGALAQATPMAASPLSENNAAVCSDGIDNDTDGSLDCADSECAVFPICISPPAPGSETTVAACSNGGDDDSDGNIDCSDSDCSSLGICLLTPPLPPSSSSGTTALPIEVPATSTPGIDNQIPVITPRFYGAGSTIELKPDAFGQFGALSGSTILVSVPLEGLGIPDKGYVVVDNALYSLSPGSFNTYIAQIVAPSPGIYPLSVALTFSDGGSAVADFSLVSQGGGRVVEEGLLGQTENPVAGALVRLFIEQGGIWIPWNGAVYGQVNPQFTDAGGNFSYIVPEGRYYAEIEKDNYLKVTTDPFTVTKNVYGPIVGLIPIPPSPIETISSTSSLITNVVSTTQNVAQQLVFGATVVKNFFKQPQVQEVVETAVAPSVAALSIATVATALPAVNSLAYLQYIFTQPFLFFGRRRRNKWGVVYNSLTKQPIELAIIRLIQHESGLIAQTRVTDKLGRYSFLPKAGKYHIELAKGGYIFPSQYLKDKQEDADYLDLYHGSVFEVTKDGLVALNIPVDPIVVEEPPRKILWKVRLRAIQKIVSLGSLIVMGVILLIAPTWYVAALFIGQFALYFLFRRLAIPAKPKDWGVIMDKDERAPLSRSIVRIFDKQFNKLLETQVTDTSGKYGFFARKNVYYITAEKEGYEKHISSDIDLTSKDEGVIDQKIEMEKKKKESQDVS